MLLLVAYAQSIVIIATVPINKAASTILAISMFLFIILGLAGLDDLFQLRTLMHLIKSDLSY